MKKIIISLCAIVLIVAINGCNKDEQSRYIKVEILKKTGQEIVNQENAIDRDRASYAPSTYASLAQAATEKVLAVLLKELKPDSLYSTNQGDIPMLVGKYDEYWRDNHPKKKRKVWDRLKVGVNIDVYRVCDAYSEKLLSRLKGYCESVVNGPIEWTDGTRNATETEIQYLFIHDPDTDVVWQYRERLYEYFLNFAQDPNNKAKHKRDGFMNFGWGN